MAIISCYNPINAHHGSLISYEPYNTQTLNYDQLVNWNTTIFALKDILGNIRNMHDMDIDLTFILYLYI